MPLTDDEIREMAKARVSFRWNLVSYVVVNAFLVLLWLVGNDFATPSLWGDDPGDAYFWPIWPLLGWGVGLAFHGYGAYGGGKDAVAREEAKIRAEHGMK